MNINKIISACFIFFYGYTSNAQTGKNIFSIGVHGSVPVYTTGGSNKTTGIGIDIKAEHFLFNHFSGSASIGYDHFTGAITYWNNITDQYFSLIPIFIGCRYYLKQVYLGIETGPVIKASKNVYSHNTISPSFGILIKKFDMGVRLVYVSSMASIPENTFLQRGDYSFATLRLAYNY